MGDALSIESLWNDDCGRAVMDKVLPDDIKGVL